MTSEPDSTPRRRPPTIDLKATEIETEAQAVPNPGETPGQGGAEQAALGQGSAAASPSRSAWHVISAVGGAAAAAAILIGLYFAGIIPVQTVTQPTAFSDASHPANSATTKISSQLDKIETQLQAHPAEPALAGRVASIEAQTKTLSDSLAAANRRLDGIALAAQSAREHADAASADLKGTAQNTVQRRELDALANRIATLEHSIKSLSETTAQHTASADDRAARAAVAAAALRTAVERGAPYAAELAAVKTFGADQAAIAALRPFATDGVPSAGDLAHQLSQLVPALKSASGARPADASFLGRLKENAKNLVRITSINAPAGNEPSAIIGRLGADAERADIAAALSDVAHLPPSAKTIVEPWVQKANARDAAIAASRRIAASTLAAVTNANPQ